MRACLEKLIIAELGYIARCWPVIRQGRIRKCKFALCYALSEPEMIWLQIFGGVRGQEGIFVISFDHERLGAEIVGHPPARVPFDDTVTDIQCLEIGIGSQ